MTVHLIEPVVVRARAVGLRGTAEPATVQLDLLTEHAQSVSVRLSEARLRSQTPLLGETLVVEGEGMSRLAICRQSGMIRREGTHLLSVARVETA